MTRFHPVSEVEVTRAIAGSFLRQFDEYAQSDVIIVGGGPSGLVAGRDLAQEGLKVLVVERNNYLGGGFWVGGYFMNKFTVRAPGQEVLDELGVPYEEAKEGLYVADAPHACSRLIAAACDAGVKFLNLTLLEDIVLWEGRVAGVVINWSPIAYLPKEIAALDPVPRIDAPYCAVASTCLRVRQRQEGNRALRSHRPVPRSDPPCCSPPGG